MDGASCKGQIKALSNTASEGIVVIGKDGKVVFANQAIEKVLGLNPKQLLGASLKDDVWNIVTTLHTPLDGMSLAIERPGGQQGIISVRPAILTDEEGKPAGFVLVFSDFTKTVRDSEKIIFQESILNQVHNAVIATDTIGKIVYWNKFAEKLYEWTAQEVLGKDIFKVIVSPVSYRKAVDILHEIETKGFWDGEFLATTKHARAFAANAILTSIKDSRGKVTGYLGLSMDITERKRTQEALRRAQAELETRVRERTADLLRTNALLKREIAERKQAEEALRRSEEKYRTLINHASDAIILTDLEGQIIEVNKKAEELLGYGHDELLKMSILQLHPPEHLERHSIAFKEMVDKGIGILNDAFVIRKDGRKVLVDITGSVVEYAGKKVAQGIFRDMSEKQRSKELSDALNNINMAISSTLDFDEIMKRVVKHSAEALGADSASVALREDEYWIARHFFGLGADYEGARITGNELKFLNQVIKAGKPTAISDALHDERVDSKLVRQYGIRSILAIPLIIRNNVVGVLRFAYVAAPVDFGPTQLDFATKLAAYIALAIENAWLYEAERNIADTLQEALLSMPERLPGIDFAHLYNSATEAAKVGGDFYDVFELEHNQIGILIGDVSGKGLEAATLTSLIKNTIRAYAYGERSPASIIAKTNETLHRSSDPSIFATLFFAILDLETGRLVYCNGGHPLPVLKRKTSEIILLTSESPIVGAFLNLTFHEAEEVLDQGDILVLYTDGVIEARRDKEFFGETRLLDFTRRLSRQSAQQITQAIFNEVISFTGGNLFDDLALLVLAIKDTGTRDVVTDSQDSRANL